MEKLTAKHYDVNLYSFITLDDEEILLEGRFINLNATFFIIHKIIEGKYTLQYIWKKMHAVSRHITGQCSPGASPELQPKFVPAYLAHFTLVERTDIKQRPLTQKECFKKESTEVVSTAADQLIAYLKGKKTSYAHIS